MVMTKPVIDFGKGGGGLPLESVGELKSMQDLVAGLTHGYQLRVDCPTEQTITTAGTFPNLDLLKIDLSNGTVKGRYRPKFNNGHSRIESSVSARNFQYVADPLTYQHGQSRWEISATDVRFGLLRDGDGKPSLVMTDVNQGEMHFAIKMADLKPMLLASAKTHAKGGFWVSDVSLDLKSNNPHEAEADMHVKAVWLLVPTSFHIHARAVVDANCNVTLSDVHCTPDDVGGALLAGFIDSAIAKYNNRTMPLAAWPGNRIVLRDVALSVTDELQFSAWFESRHRIASR